jgi:hypothetical protein
MGNWRDEAIAVGPGAKPHWRDEAVPIGKPEPETGAGQAALEHYGNSATLGYLPHLQAGLEPVTDKILDAITGGDVAKDADWLPSGAQYVKSRDANAHRLEREESEHPVASALGTGAGVAATAALPVGAAAKGATLTAKALAAGKAGAAMGALANPGDVEGEIDPLQATDRAKNAAISGVLSAAAPVAIDKLAGASQKVSRYLRHKASDLAEKATGATGKQAEKFVPGTGRELLSKDVVNFGSSPKNVAENAGKLLDAAEASKSDIIKNQLAGTPVDRNRIYNAIKSRIQSLRGDESQVGVVRALEQKADDLLEASQHSGSSLPLPKSEEVRKGFDKLAKWDSNSDAASREANKILAGLYREEGEAAASAANPALGAKFKADKALQHKLIPVADAAEQRASQLKQSPMGGLLDIAAAGGGGTVGALLGGSKESTATGAALALAAKGLRSRGASMGAVTSDLAARAARGASRSIRGINPQVAAVIASRLGRDVTGGGPKIEKDPNPILNDQRLMDLFRKDPGLIDAIDDERTRQKVKRAVASGGGSSSNPARMRKE